MIFYRANRTVAFHCHPFLLLIVAGSYTLADVTKKREREGKKEKKKRKKKKERKQQQKEENNNKATTTTTTTITTKTKTLLQPSHNEISAFHLPTIPLSDEVAYLTRKI